MYILCLRKGKEIAQYQAKDFNIYEQKIVIFRSKDDKARTLDAYCASKGNLSERYNTLVDPKFFANQVNNNWK